MMESRMGMERAHQEADKQRGIYDRVAAERDSAEAIKVMVERMEALGVTPADMKPELVDLLLRHAKDLASKC